MGGRREKPGMASQLIYWLVSRSYPGPARHLRAYAPRLCTTRISLHRSWLRISLTYRPRLCESGATESRFVLDKLDGTRLVAVTESLPELLRDSVFSNCHTPRWYGLQAEPVKNNFLSGSQTRERTNQNGTDLRPDSGSAASSGSTYGWTI